MVYKYPDKNGNMVETPHLNTFIKGIDGAIKHGYGPGHNTNYQAPAAKKVTFAQAQKRLREQTGTDFISSSEDLKKAEFASAIGREVARQLQAAGMIQREQAPLVARQNLEPATRQVRQGVSWAEAQKKLAAELGEDFLNPGAALRAKSKSQGPRAVRRFGPNLAACKLKQF